MSRQQFIIRELQRRYGVDVIRRWAAQLIDPESEGGTMADDIDRLADLLDVLLTNPRVGNALVYDGTKWINELPKPSRTPDTAYREGREWWTDFSSSTADATWATATNLTYGTDGGSSAVSLTAPGTKGRFEVNDRSIKDFEVLVLFRAAPGAGFGIQDIALAPIGRRLDDSNYWYGQAAFTSGNSVMNAHSTKAGADTASPTAALSLPTNATTYRWLKFRVLGDIAYLKHWLVSADEPDWQIIRRFRAPFGASGSTSSADNQDFGACGFQAQYGGIVQQIRVTELLRNDSNLLISPAPTYLDMVDSYPVGWYPTKDVSDTVNVQAIPDRFGITRNAFHLIKVGTAGSCFWTQDLWALAPDSFITRKSPHPRVKFPRTIEVSLWTKGSNIVDAGTLASTFVAYQYNVRGAILNTSDLNYFRTLGPNGNAYAGAPLGATGKGDGTWDWTQTIWRMPFPSPETVTRMRIDIGLHDDSSTGELWFTDVQLRPVA